MCFQLTWCDTLLSDTTTVISTHTHIASCKPCTIFPCHSTPNNVCGWYDVHTKFKKWGEMRAFWWPSLVMHSENWEGRSPTSLSRSSRLPRVNVLVIHEELLLVWPVRVFSSFILFSFLHFPTLTNFLFHPLLLSSFLSSLLTSYDPPFYLSCALLLL